MTFTNEAKQKHINFHQDVGARKTISPMKHLTFQNQISKTEAYNFSNRQIGTNLQIDGRRSARSPGR